MTTGATKRRKKAPLPSAPFAFLAVEGGDEERLCVTLLSGTVYARPLVIWPAHGHNVDDLAEIAALEPSITYASHVGVVLDAEEDPPASADIARKALTHLGVNAVGLTHAKMTGGAPDGGFFLLPDAGSRGASERLLRHSAADSRLAACVDQFETCAAVTGATSANRDKSWVQAYLSASRAGGYRVHDVVADPTWFITSAPLFDPLRDFLRYLVT